MAAFLHGFRQALPPGRISQEQSLAWLKKLHKADDVKARMIDRLSCKPGDIDFRYSELPEFSGRGSLFKESGEVNPSVLTRGKLVQKASKRAISELGALEETTSHAFHVSCTGYVSPSPLQEALSDRQSNTVAITHLYHMGCYAAFPAVRLAASLCSKDGSVRVIHSEVCTAHFQPEQTQPDQLVVQSLFSDGHCAYNVSSTPRSMRSIRIDQVAEARMADTSGHMTWDVGPTGFLMTLHKEIPDLIKKEIKSFVEGLGAKADIDIRNALYCIHPGGPRIIQNIAESMKLESSQIRHSKKILRARGNMSSATVPHIWGAILDDKEVEPGTPLISLAFGPGLTMFGMAGMVVV